MLGRKRGFNRRLRSTWLLADNIVSILIPNGLDPVLRQQNSSDSVQEPAHVTFYVVWELRFD